MLLWRHLVVILRHGKIKHNFQIEPNVFLSKIIWYWTNLKDTIGSLNFKINI